MIVLYGVNKLTEQLTENSKENFILQIPLDLQECRRFKNIAFLCDIFLNARFEDSFGKPQEIRLSLNYYATAIVFDNKNLNQLHDEYSRHRKLRQSSGEIFDFEPETAVFEFIQICRAKGLQLVSFSKLYLQEYE